MPGLPMICSFIKALPFTSLIPFLSTFCPTTTVRGPGALGGDGSVGLGSGGDGTSLFKRDTYAVGAADAGSAEALDIPGFSIICGFIKAVPFVSVIPGLSTFCPTTAVGGAGALGGSDGDGSADLSVGN